MSESIFLCLFILPEIESYIYIYIKRKNLLEKITVRVVKPSTKISLKTSQFL
jgi:hypothetical protein